MKTTIITVNQIEGFHSWPDPPQYLAFLANRHRHIFVVECEFVVNHENRDIEIISQQHQVEAYFRDKYGDPAEFADRSCETIARELLTYYPNCRSVTVREDGYGGGRVIRGWPCDAWR